MCTHLFHSSNHSSNHSIHHSHLVDRASTPSAFCLPPYPQRPMQLFGMHQCPQMSAQVLCDAHVVKMTLETTQILYTSLRANLCAWVDKQVSVQKASTSVSVGKKRKHASNDDDYTLSPTSSMTTLSSNTNTNCDNSVDNNVDNVDDDIIIEYDLVPPYKSTHRCHPCVLWASACDAHFLWTLMHAHALVQEYSLRFNKVHTCWHHISHITTNWMQHGWSSSKCIPKSISVQEWLDSLTPTLRDHNISRVATHNSPIGCKFGVVCMEPDQYVYNYNDDADHNIDWTASYAKLYNFKRDCAFKKPMLWYSKPI